MGSVPAPAREVSPVAAPDFGGFYRAQYRPVLALAYVLSGSRSGAEDLAQDAFAAAHRAWERVGCFDDPGAWVRRVVANRSVSLVRRRVAEARALVRLANRREPIAALPEDAAAVWALGGSAPQRESPDTGALPPK